MSNPSIAADKTPWYQWDTGLTVTVSGGEMNECHFANRKQGTAYVQAVINGVARVPDELLQVAAPIKAYGYVSDGAGGQTYIEETFDVIARNIPSDYTYTKTAQKTIRDAEQARDEAVQAAKDAKASELAADDSAIEASNSARSAGESASEAATSASNAAKSAGEAAKSADNAATSASNAADEASAASGSASAAAQSATDASNAKVAAQTAKAGAETAASNAATSASNAASSATAAEKSASDAAASVGAINIIAPKTVDIAASSEIDGSVAVGAGSVAKKLNEFSIGNDTLTREITNVSEPTEPTSASTKKYTDDNDAKTLTEAKKYTDDNASNALVGKVSGKLLHVEDAWPGKPLGLTIDGACKQVTTIGKNLLNGCDSYFKDEDAEYKNYLWGYTLGNNPLVLDKPLEPGTYTFSIYTTKPFYMYFAKKPYVTGEYANFSANRIINDDTRFGLKRYYGTFTLHNTYDLVGIYSEGYGACFGGMIENGTTVSAYEPYTAGNQSPSPDYPQDITVVENPVLRVTGADTSAAGTSLPITLPAEHPYLAALPDGTHDEIVIDKDGNASLVARVQKVDVSNLPAPTVTAVLDSGLTRYEYRGFIKPKAKQDSAAFAPSFSSVIDYRFKKQGMYTSESYIVVGATADPTETLKTGGYIYTTLATPITYSLGKLDIPSLPETISNVWTDAELTTNMSMTYKRDINVAFDNIVQAVVAAAAGE